MIRAGVWSGGRQLLLAGSVLLLVGCGGEGEQSTPTAQPTPASSATAAPVLPTPTPLNPEVGAVVWAEGLEAGSGAPAPRVSSFAADAPALYAVIRVAHLRDGSVVTAAWTYNDTELNGATRAAVLQAAYPSGWLAFTLGRDPARTWPPGTYGVTITLDGVPVQSAEVEVTAVSEP